MVIDSHRERKEDPIESEPEPWRTSNPIEEVDESRIRMNDPDSFESDLSSYEGQTKNPFPKLKEEEHHFFFHFFQHN
jgi:hypothetical protein